MRDFLSINKIFFACACILLLSWIAGLHTATLAQILFPLSLVSLFFYKETTDLNSLKKLHISFVVIWLIVLLLFQFAQVKLGLQGIDFAIFTDVIRSFSLSGTFDSILLGEGPRSFFTHHFSPILAVPGILAFWMAPQFAGIVVHVFVVACALILLAKFAKALRLDAAVAALALLLLCLNPSFRVGLSWEIHDETFGLAFVVLAYWAWALQKHKLAAVALVLCMLCKETFFFFAILFTLMVFIWEYLDKSREYNKLNVYFGASLLALVGIAIYIIWPLALFQKTFDAVDRLSSFEQLFSWSTVSAKTSFLWRLLLPLPFLAFLSIRGLVVALPSAAFLGPILLSNFENMYFPYNYYSVLPTLILFIASLVSLAEYSKIREIRVPVAAYLALISMSLMMAGHSRPVKTIRSLSSKPTYSAAQLEFVPRDAVVIAQDFDVQYLLGVKKIYRAWTAERIAVPWTHIVVRRDSKLAWKTELLNQSNVCAENQNWILRCRK